MAGGWRCCSSEKLAPNKTVQATSKRLEPSGCRLIFRARFDGIIMSYHLTILRSKNSKQLPISLEEAKLVATKIGYWKYSETPRTFKLLTKNGESTLWYNDGELWTKTPQVWEIDHIINFAKELGGRVRGDEFETYITADETFTHPDDIILRKIEEEKSAAMLQKDISSQKRIFHVIIGFFLLLGLIGFLIGKWFESR